MSKEVDLDHEIPHNLEFNFKFLLINYLKSRKRERKMDKTDYITVTNLICR